MGLLISWVLLSDLGMNNPTIGRVGDWVGRSEMVGKKKWVESYMGNEAGLLRKEDIAGS